MTIPLDYETLRIIWWLLLGVLLIGLAVMDGFDMGVAFLNPVLGKTDGEKRAIINTVGPVWEGNQVWLITGGGAIFAAFPLVYATAFSGFYIAMLAVLISLILRPISFEFRNKFPENRRFIFDITLFLSGLLPPLVFGVAFGNLFQGVPFYFDDAQMPHYVSADGPLGWLGGFFALLNPLGLLCGLVSVCMLAGHGAVYLAIKTEGIIRARAIKAAHLFILLWATLFAAGGLWIGHVDGYSVASTLAYDAPSNPTAKTVVRNAGVWLANYKAYPALYVVPALGFLSALLTIVLLRARHHATAFIPSGLMVACTIATAGISLFPFLMPSSLNPDHSLTIWDSSSSRLTLWLMTLAAAIFVPIVLSYTSWVFSVLRGPVKEEHIRTNNEHFY